MIIVLYYELLFAPPPEFTLHLTLIVLQLLKPALMAPKRCKNGPMESFFRVTLTLDSGQTLDGGHWRHNSNAVAGEKRRLVSTIGMFVTPADLMWLGGTSAGRVCQRATRIPTKKHITTATTDSTWWRNSSPSKTKKERAYILPPTQAHTKLDG